MMSVLQLVYWKALAIVCILLVLVQQFIGNPEWIPHRFHPHAARPNSAAQHGITHAHWSFKSERDRNEHGLSSEQCHAAFPDLYSEIDRATEQWRSRGVTADSIEMVPGNDGSVRLLIHNHRLRIVRTKGMFRADFRHRILAIVHQIHRALSAVRATDEPLPDIEFNIIVDDIPNMRERDDLALWSFTRAYNNEYHDNVWLIPDFHFFAPDFQAGGGSFEEMQDRSRSHDSPIKDKIPKVAWRGVEWTNPGLRKKLLQATEGRPWADVAAMKWDNQSSVMAMDDFCQYAFLVNTEGRSWSARLTHLLNCNSVPVVHDPQWLTHYYHLLMDGSNCVRVERDFSDLEEKVQYYLEHGAEAQAIADTSVATFRDKYTSPAATSCYWRQLFQGWSTVAFTPDAFEPVPADKDAPRKLRGISYEEFM